MQKTIKIFGRLVSTKQVILGVVALVIFIGAAIYLVRFFFPSTPQATRAATSTTTQEQIDTDVFNSTQFKNLQDQGGTLTTPNAGRTNPFTPVTNQNSETSGTIQ